MSTQRERRSDTSKRGKEWYVRIRPLVDNEANVGKIVTIDVDSGDYEVDADLLTAGERLRVRHPDAVIWSERIGYDVVFAIGGTRTRIAQ